VASNKALLPLPPVACSLFPILYNRPAPAPFESLEASLSTSLTKVSPPAAVDLDYHMEDFEPGAGHGTDSAFYHRRTDQAVMDEALSRTPGRVLDVACGSGELAARLAAAGWEAWGLEASSHMLGLGRWQDFDRHVLMVRGIAEALPFPDDSFDCVVCKGSLDHFADQAAFMRDAARVLRPEGRLVIAIANFDSLSRRLGRRINALARLLGMPPPHGRPYWQPPPTHMVWGDLAYVRSLGGPLLALERCYGVSLLHHFLPWRLAVDRLPQRLGWRALGVLDTMAHRWPAASDMIVSVWHRKQ
jgi:SAM-dependent methyltransferase